MRLIDADKLILHLNDFMLQQSPIDIQDIESIHVSAVIQDCIKAVEEQPTAYDVNKVIEELKEMGNEYCKSVECNGECDCCEHASMMQSAIKIVKGGINGLN